MPDRRTEQLTQTMIGLASEARRGTSQSAMAAEAPSAEGPIWEEHGALGVDRRGRVGEAWDRARQAHYLGGVPIESDDFGAWRRRLLE